MIYLISTVMLFCYVYYLFTMFFFYLCCLVHFLFLIFFIFKKCFFRGNLYKNKILNLFYWNTVGLQCYINFCCTEKWFRFIYVQICIYSNIHTHTHTHIISFQFSSVSQLCPPLCDPMNRSMSGLPVHHQLPEFTQTHIQRVSDAI